jgi:hypothetical protein
LLSSAPLSSYPLCRSCLQPTPSGIIGVIYSEIAENTSAPENARKYTQKNPINRYGMLYYEAFATAKTKK